MRRSLAAASILALAAGGLPAASTLHAQETPAPLADAPIAPQGFSSPVLMVQQQRLFEDSAFGKTSLSRLEAASRALQAEIRQIESDLEIEERLLTERRDQLTPEEFRPLARAFDDKVEKIRAAWGAKDRDLKRQREQDQQTFFASAVPVLAEVMREMGAVVLVDQSSVVLSLDRVDITDIAIARIDERLSEDTPEEPAPDPQPQPNP